MQSYSNPPRKSDEDLQKVTVGERKPHNAPVTLLEYDPESLINSIERLAEFVLCSETRYCNSNMLAQLRFRAFVPSPSLISY